MGIGQGLTYMQARYYDPLIGRFYSNDPIGFTGAVDTFNRYSYVANNPYKYVDPSGMTKCIDKSCTRSSVDTDVDGDGTTDITFKNDVAGAAAPPNNFTTQTATMIEGAVRDSGVDSVHINSTTGSSGANRSSPRHGNGQAVDINSVNGQPVIKNGSGVTNLQDAFANQGNIRENYGPSRVEITGAAGGSPTNRANPASNKQTPWGSQAYNKSVVNKHKNHIHVSGQN